VNRRRNLTTCALVLGLPLAIGLTQLVAPVEAQSTQQTPHPEVPDAPTPQAPKPMSDFKDQVTPGIGSQSSQSTTTTSPSSPSSSTVVPAEGQTETGAPSSQPPAASAPDTFQETAPEIPAAGTGPDKIPTIISTTTAVEVPVTVKDSKGHLVGGLTWRDFRVFENNQRQPIRIFTVDPYPLSVAYVIDQSVTADVMSKVNTSLGAIQGALAPYDEVAVFTYNNGPKELTGFTGAQSHLLTAVLALSKATGREEGVPVNSGPLAGCSISSNGACVDPNLQVGKSAGGAEFMNIPKEIHTLNDAILRAAVALSTRPVNRRRVIYVVSDGKEYGSKATTKQVIKYLQGHNIAVNATLVGDSARWGEGYLSRFHIPFQMNDNVLIRYAHETGGALDAERNANGMEKSYQLLAEQARRRYTLYYYSHEPAIDGKYRSIEVRVDRPNVDVTAKRGYYPTAQDVR
jgi:VWFA-related protein